MSKTLASLAFVSLIIFGVFGHDLPSFYSPALEDDADSVMYTTFASNIVRYPLSVSRGQMSEHVGAVAGPLFEGHPLTWYRDHPSLMIALSALAQFIVPDPLIAGRQLNLLFSIAFVFICAAWVAALVSPLAGVVSFLIIFGIPIFWIHSVVVNIQSITIFFSILASLFFALWLHPHRWKINPKTSLQLALLFFVCAAFSDWPSYFLLIPVGLHLLFHKRWAPFFSLFLGSILVFGFTVYWLYIPAPDEIEPSSSGWNFVKTIKVFFSNQSQSDLASIPVVDAWFSAREFFFNSFGRPAEVFLVILIFLAARLYFKQKSLIAFVFFCCLSVAIFNNFLFHQWAATHPYWNYYFIPSFLLGIGVIAESIQREKVRKIVLVFVVILYGAMVPKSWEAMQKKVKSKAEAINPTELLSSNQLEGMLKPGSHLLAYSPSPYKGFGFLNRPIFDRTLRNLQKMPMTEFCQKPDFYLLVHETEIPKGHALQDLPWIRLKALSIKVLNLLSISLSDCELIYKGYLSKDAN